MRLSAIVGRSEHVRFRRLPSAEPARSPLLPLGFVYHGHPEGEEPGEVILHGVAADCGLFVLATSVHGGQTGINLPFCSGRLPLLGRGNQTCRRWIPGLSRQL